ncbi:hypothetical protein KJ765_00725 [Candidatus Micrarchaeota archaeon]|nr:hypothetical protein [Candidatus Micrarchaeota archaeon]
MLGSSAFSYVNKNNQTYWLHETQSHKVTLYFFNKVEDKAIPLPKGYYVVESPKTALPVLKKEKL